MNISLCSFVTVLVLFCVPFSKSDRTDNDNNSDDQSGDNNLNFSVFCLDIKPQPSLNIEQLMGTWYGNEIIKHTQDVPGIFNINSCVVIGISDITQQMQMSVREFNYNNYRRTSTGSYQQEQQQPRPIPTKYLRLIWSEKDDNLEYTFNYTEATPGVWHNFDDQRGSLVVLNKYTQFHGSVQVVKAVNDHLVLTFCDEDVKSSIYTIVLSRQPQGLTSKQLRGIRNLISRRGLAVDTIHKVCDSGATGIRASLLALILGILFIITRKQ